MADKSSDIQDNALDPKKVAGDQGSVEMHSIKDQIDADNHARASAAMKRKSLPFRFLRGFLGGIRD